MTREQTVRAELPAAWHHRPAKKESDAAAAAVATAAAAGRPKLFEQVQEDMLVRAVVLTNFFAAA